MTALARKTSLGERGPIGGTIALASYFGADACITALDPALRDLFNASQL